MPPAHRNSSKAAERRRQRRQRRRSEESPQRSSQTPKMAPLQLDPRRTGASPGPAAVPTAKLEPETEFAIVRRDLWRLTVYSIICLALMLAVLFVLNG